MVGFLGFLYSGQTGVSRFQEACYVNFSSLLYFRESGRIRLKYRFGSQSVELS